MKKKFKISNKIIGDENPCFLIAEIGSNHIEIKRLFIN